MGQGEWGRSPSACEPAVRGGGEERSPGRSARGQDGQGPLEPAAALGSRGRCGPQLLGKSLHRLRLVRSGPREPAHRGRGDRPALAALRSSSSAAGSRSAPPLGRQLAAGCGRGGDLWPSSRRRPRAGTGPQVEAPREVGPPPAAVGRGGPSAGPLPPRPAGLSLPSSDAPPPSPSPRRGQQRDGPQRPRSRTPQRAPHSRHAAHGLRRVSRVAALRATEASRASPARSALPAGRLAPVGQAPRGGDCFLPGAPGVGGDRCWGAGFPTGVAEGQANARGWVRSPGANVVTKGPLLGLWSDSGHL